jgi:surface protein
MSQMFKEASNFNQPLNSWNVSNVTNMYKMFMNANKFDRRLNKWNMIQVKRKDRMFEMSKNGILIENNPDKYLNGNLINKTNEQLIKQTIGRNSFLPSSRGPLVSSKKNKTTSQAMNEVSSNDNLMRNIREYLGGKKGHLKEGKTRKTRKTRKTKKVKKNKKTHNRRTNRRTNSRTNRRTK